jgi:hypothetical protein
VFLASAAAIVPLAKLMEQATDALAHYLGPTYGGLLSARPPEIIVTPTPNSRVPIIEPAIEPFSASIRPCRSAVMPMMSRARCPSV